MSNQLTISDVADENGDINISSLDFVRMAGMRHADVIRSIESMAKVIPISQRRPALSDYLSPRGRALKKYELDSNHYLYLVSTLNESARWKISCEYVEMREFIQKQQALSLDMQEKKAIRLHMDNKNKDMKVKALNTKLMVDGIAHNLDMNEDVAQFCTNISLSYGIKGLNPSSFWKTMEGNGYVKIKRMGVPLQKIRVHRLKKFEKYFYTDKSGFQEVEGKNGKEGYTKIFYTTWITSLGQSFFRNNLSLFIEKIDAPKVKEQDSLF